jgi:hypothetical protein
MKGAKQSQRTSHVKARIRITPPIGEPDSDVKALARGSRRERRAAEALKRRQKNNAAHG